MAPFRSAVRTVSWPDWSRAAPQHPPEYSSHFDAHHTRSTSPPQASERLSDSFKTRFTSTTVPRPAPPTHSLPSHDKAATNRRQHGPLNLTFGRPFSEVDEDGASATAKTCGYPPVRLIPRVRRAAFLRRGVPYKNAWAWWQALAISGCVLAPPCGPGTKKSRRRGGVSYEASSRCGLRLHSTFSATKIASFLDSIELAVEIVEFRYVEEKREPERVTDSPSNSWAREAQNRNRRLVGSVVSWRMPCPLHLLNFCRHRDKSTSNYTAENPQEINDTATSHAFNAFRL